MCYLCFMKISSNKKLDLKQKHLDSLFKFNPAPTIGLDISGRVIFANLSCKKILSTSKAGNDPAFFIPRDIATILKGLKSNSNKRFSRKIIMGKNIFSESILFMPEIKTILIYVAHITEPDKINGSSKNTSQKLEQRLDAKLKSDTLNRIIMDNAPVSIITIDTDGNITSVNKYFENFSKTKKYASCNIFKDEFFIRGKLVDDYRKLLTNGTPVRRENCYEKNGQGEDKYLKIIAVPLRDSKGKINGALSMAIDNTEATMMQNHLLESYNHAGLINRRISLLREMDRLFENFEDRRKEAGKNILLLLVETFSASFGALFKFADDRSKSLLPVCAAGIKINRKKILQTVARNIATILPELKKSKMKIKGFCQDFGLARMNPDKKTEYFMAIPISWEGKLRAILYLNFAAKNEWDQQELEFLDVFSSQAASLLIRAGLLK